MKGIVITPEGEVSVREFAEPLYQTVGAAIGGTMRLVNSGGLPEPFCMIVNDEGRIKKLPFHPLASFWYGTQVHGSPIVGTVVLMKIAPNEEDEPDLTGLSDTEIAVLERLIELSKNAPLPEEPHNPPRPAQVIEIPPDVDVGEFLTGLFGIGRETAIR